MKKKNDVLRQPLPPYIPFKTLSNFIGKLKDTVVPEQIDRTILHEYSGSVAGALIPALKSLRLIDDSGKTLQALHELVEAYGTTSWEIILGQQINEIYSGVIADLNIAGASKGQLEEKFKIIGAEGAVLKKCLTFYLSAAKEAKINVSPHITKSYRGRRDQYRKPARKDKEKELNNGESELGEKQKQAGMRLFNIPVLEGKSVKIIFPQGISQAEWEAVNAAMKGHISLFQGREEKK